MTARLAVYFAPRPDTELHRFGSRWLGRDAATGEAVPQPAVPGLAPDRVARLTASPRRYGFHATLKPPFRLAPGRTADELDATVAALARRHAPFRLRLALRPLHGFLALVPAAASEQIQALCDACVAGLDPFRAPPSDEELARRRAAGLSAREAEHLERWGYPYVFDRFRFHMTLSERLGGDEAAAMAAAIGPEAEAACAAPADVADLCVFEEPAPGADLRIRTRHPLGGAASPRPDDPLRAGARSA